MQKCEKLKAYEKALLDSVDAEKKTFKDIEEVANSTIQMVYKYYGLIPTSPPDTPET